MSRASTDVISAAALSTRPSKMPVPARAAPVPAIRPAIVTVQANPDSPSRIDSVERRAGRKPISATTPRPSKKFAEAWATPCTW